MEFQDKILKCIDCGADFVFTAGEQLFFHDNQFKMNPSGAKPVRQNASPCWVQRRIHPDKVSPKLKLEPCVHSVARRPPSPSGQPRAVPFSAGNVFSSGGRRLRPESEVSWLAHSLSAGTMSCGSLSARRFVLSPLFIFMAHQQG